MKKIVIIFFIALIVRFGFIAFWYQAGQGNRFSSDANDYCRIAESLKEGKGFEMFGAPTARRAPLYPLWVAFFLKYSSFPLGVRLGDAFMGALSCFLVYGIGKELFEEKTGVLAAGIFAVDYVSVRQVVSVLSETLFVFLLLVSFYFLIRALKYGKYTQLFFAGFFGGLSLLTREVLIFYFPLLIAWMLSRERWTKKCLKGVGLFLLGFLFTIGPWIVRNSLIYHKPVMITLSGGLTFYAANNPTASGGRTGGDWEIGEDTLLPRRLSAPLGTTKADQELFDGALEFILRSPGKFFKLMGRKILNTWRPYQTDSPSVIQWITGVPYVAGMIFGVLGVIFYRTRWKEFMPIFLLIGYTFLLHAVLIGEIRYRYPVMPFLMIFAAAGISHVFQKKSGKTSSEILSHHAYFII